MQIIDQARRLASDYTSRLYDLADLVRDAMNMAPADRPAAAEKLQEAVTEARAACRIFDREIVALRAETERRGVPFFIAWPGDEVDLFLNSIESTAKGW